MFAPAGTPPPLLTQIEADIREAMKAPDTRVRLEGIGMEMGDGSSEEMRRVLAADILKWGDLVKVRNIQIDQN